MKSIHQIVLNEYFEPAAGRAVRVTLAFILPLIWGMVTGDIGPAVWISITAQILSNVTIQGSYPLKVLILSGGVLACAVCGALGTFAGHHWLVAAVLMAILAFLGGFVRQSGNYGPGITIGVLLIYILALDHPGDSVLAGEMFAWILIGGMVALLFTLLAWMFVPFSPFRRSIALIWKALADWLDTFEKTHGDASSEKIPVNSLDERELLLRDELNSSMELLSRQQALAHARQNRYSFRLVELRRMASEVGNAVSSLQTLEESARRLAGFQEELFRNLTGNMAQAARRIAISILTHRPEDIYAAGLSIKKSKQSIALWQKEIDEQLITVPLIPISESLNKLINIFEEAQMLIENAFPSKGNMTFFLRNFLTGATIPQQIPWVHFEFNFRSFTFRFALRLALGMGIGIAVYKYFHIPHGYWIAMTVMIVLQPEFGATLKKAFRRMKGTVLGVTAGTLIFLFHFPLPVNVAIVTVCSLLMTWYILKNYAVAAFFITIMVIALFHLIEPVTWQLGGIRLINTLSGCGLALLGGFAFWPLWEKYRFPSLICEAIHANSIYLNKVKNALEKGEKRLFNDFIKVRREAEMT
ncbi:MAG: FUSC family protein, partial [Chitinophagaceae bacterium]